MCDRPRSFIIILNLSPPGSFRTFLFHAHSADVSCMPMNVQNSACVMSDFMPLHLLHDTARFSLTSGSTRLHLGTKCSTVRLFVDPQ